MDITTSIETDPAGTAEVTVTIFPATRYGGFLTATEAIAKPIADTALGNARWIDADQLPNYWEWDWSSNFLPAGKNTIIHTFHYTMTTPDLGPEL